MRRRSSQRVSLEMGLVGVVTTQLWHHTFLDGSLADLPIVTADNSRSEDPLPIGGVIVLDGSWSGDIEIPGAIQPRRIEIH